MTDKLKNPFLLKLFLLSKLPLAFFAGLKLRSMDENSCTVSMPFGWMTKNPFKSMYFAAQSMAAEFSTAALAVYYIDQSKENVAMLITGLRAEFVKKAQSEVRFVCQDGGKYKKAFEHGIENEDGFEVEALTEGFNAEGEIVSKFYITWSFRRRSR